MRFGAALPLAALLSSSLFAQNELRPERVTAALARWFQVECAAGPAANSQMSLALTCAHKNNPDGAPLLVGAATLEQTQLASQIAAVASAASKPKVKHRKDDWSAKLQGRLALQERSPAGRLGFYGFHPGLGESALSFVVVDPTTLRSLQLMYTYRPNAGGQPINGEATSKSMQAILDDLKNAAFALEKHYWR